MSVELQTEPRSKFIPEPELTRWELGIAFANTARHWPFLAVLLAYFLFTSYYIAATPVWETPDEPSHFAYVRYIQMHGGPPIQSFVEGQNEVETGHHPPLYYYLGRWLIGDQDLSDFKRLQHNPYFKFSNNDGGINVFLHDNAATRMPNSLAAAYKLRGLSMFFGAGTVLLTYLSGLLIFGKTGAGQSWRWAGQGRAPATLAAVGVGLLPQFGFLSGAINNDNAIIFFCALSLCLCLWLIQRPEPPRWWAFALVGMVVGLGLLSKYNEITYIPVVALAVAVVARRARSWRLFWQGAFISGGTCLVVCGWWFGRAQLLYGDPAGWGMWRSSFASLDQSDAFKWNSYSLSHIWGRWFNSFWGVFGWMNISFEPVTYSWLAWTIAIAGLGLALFTLATIRPYFVKARLKSPGLSQITLAESLKHHPGLTRDRTALSLIFLALSLTLVLISALNYAITFGDAGTQGRYLFPLLPPFMLGAAAGLLYFPGLLRHWQKSAKSEKVAGWLAWLLVAIIAVGLGWLNLHALNDRIRPAYALPTELNLKNLPSTATPMQGGEFSPGMWLAGYEVDPPFRELKLGQATEIRLTLYWRVRNSTRENWIGFVHLYYADQDIGQQDGAPGKGRYQTYFWKKGEIVRDERLIKLKPGKWREVLNEQALLRFQLGWHNSRDGGRALLNHNKQPDFFLDWDK